MKHFLKQIFCVLLLLLGAATSIQAMLFPGQDDVNAALAAQAAAKANERHDEIVNAINAELGDAALSPAPSSDEDSTSYSGGDDDSGLSGSNKGSKLAGHQGETDEFKEARKKVLEAREKRKPFSKTKEAMDKEFGAPAPAPETPEQIEADREARRVEAEQRLLKREEEKAAALAPDSAAAKKEEEKIEKQAAALEKEEEKLGEDLARAKAAEAAQRAEQLAKEENRRKQEEARREQEIKEREEALKDAAHQEREAASKQAADLTRNAALKQEALEKARATSLQPDKDKKLRNSWITINLKDWIKDNKTKTALIAAGVVLTIDNLNSWRVVRKTPEWQITPGKLDCAKMVAKNTYTARGIVGIKNGIAHAAGYLASLIKRK